MLDVVAGIVIPVENKCPFKKRKRIMIEDGLRFCEEYRRCEASYLLIKSPTALPNNRCVAKATLRSTEKRLKKNKELGAT